MMNRPLAERAAFALGLAPDATAVMPGDLTADSPTQQAHAWAAYADGYEAHARTLAERLATLMPPPQAELDQLAAEIADATAQVRAARQIAAFLRAPWRRRGQVSRPEALVA